MKIKLFTQLLKGLLVFILAISFTTASATKARYAPLLVSDFRLSIQNLTQASDRTLEFDVYLLDVDASQQFELSSAQLGILVDLGIKPSSGTLSLNMNNTGSPLVATSQQFPSSTIVTAPNGYPTQAIIKVSGRSTTAGSGAVILTTGIGTFLSHFTITCTAPFVANSVPNLIFTSNTVLNPLYPTKVNVFDGTTDTNLGVTPGTNAIVNGNPILNKTIATQASTGGGSYCQGEPGVAVGLAGSEVGVTYTLYKDNVATATTVVGTGSAISFGNQTAGVYTVKGVYGTQTWNIANMTGSATVTETPLTTASVSIASDLNGVCAGTSVTFTATPTNGGTTPTYQWYKGVTQVGTNSATYTYAPANGDVITVQMVSNAAPCLVGSPATSNQVTMVVNPLLPVSVSIAASQNNVCAGTSVTFTATPTNGGTTPTYQWYKGATAVGTNSATYTYAPANGDVITVSLTSNAVCGTGSPATSNQVTMVVNPLLPVSVSVAASQNNICAGTSVTFTATPTNGGTTPTYQWYKGATPVGTNSATYTYTPANGDVITVSLISNAVCGTGSPATSNQVTMVVNPLLPVSVSIAASQNNVCAGTSVTFTATPTNGGTTPTYQWYKGATAVGTNSATYTYAPANGDVITVSLTSNAVCGTGSPATSNQVTMVVNPLLPVSVSIAASQNNVCAGTSVTFTATPTNGGTTPTYQWYKGATPVGTNSATYTYTPANGDVITVSLISNAVCGTGSPATSNQVTMVVNPLLPVSVSIAASQNNVCAGTSVTFTATPTNGGTTPTYQWYKGVTPVGTNSATYTYAPANGDVITVSLISNAVCGTGSPATSNQVTMVVNPLLPVSVSIAASQNNVCAGTSVTFTATPTNGGTTPTYQWYKGVTPVGTNSATYTYAPANGDVITVSLISNAVCGTGSPATSNQVTMVVNPLVTASVTIEASSNPVQNGVSVTFTPTPINGGAAPTYEWFKNSVSVATTDTYTYVPSDGDQLYAIMTSNVSPCVNQATSNTITMSVSPGTGTFENGKVTINIYSFDKNIFVYCTEIVKQINVYNAVGTLVKIVSNSSDMHKISMVGNPEGCYIVSLISNKNVYSGKVILK